MVWIRMPAAVHCPDMPFDPVLRAFTTQPDGESYSLDVESLDEAETHPATALAKNAVAMSNGTRAKRGSVQLREYQFEAIDAVQEMWNSGHSAPIVVLPTGSGKTLVASEIIHRFCAANPRDKAIFLAHRTELLDQTRDKLMLMSDSISVGIVQGDSNQLGRRATVASVQTIGHHSGRRITELLEHGPYGLLIIDECFPAGTLVGDVAIEDLKFGDLVPSWDEVTKTHCVRRVVAVMQRDAPDRLYCISTNYSSANYSHVDATGNHPFLTRRGWIPAAELRAGDDELLRQDDTWHRIDRVDVLERRSDGNFFDDVCRNGKVYNIEVAGTHTYVANGFVVHNCHHAVATGYVRTIDRLKEANPALVILGITATPDRADGTALDSVFDGVAYQKSLFWMIENSYLVPPTGVAVKLDIDLDSIATREGDFVTTQLSKIMNQPAVNFAVVRAWQEHGFDRKMLAFCVDVAHAEALSQAFVDAGYPAAVVHGELPKKERERLLGEFRKGALKILATCEVLVEGYDDPSCEGIICARPTQSRALHAQMIGRGLRLYPGKTECTVIDVVGNSEKHSLATLSSLAGLEPVGPEAPSESNAAPEQEELGFDPEAPVVSDVRATNVRELDFERLARRRELRYAWRETTVGWSLQIPRVGYFLVAWADAAHTKCTVHFYDLREGKRDNPPVHVLSSPVDFELAYGMVEGELERFLRARATRNNPMWGNRGDSDGGEEESSGDASFFAWIDLEDGLTESLDIPDALMMNDASWRRRPRTAKQTQLLSKYGARITTLPETAGEAADLITILQIEHDHKMRLPPTPKQLGYLKHHQIPFTREITKQGAARLIVGHRRATGS